MNENAKPCHDLIWDEHNIKHFWNVVSSTDIFSNTYFSYHAGEGIINFTRFLTPLRGKILEYGCGKGHLINHLLKLGISCEGCDYSDKTISSLNERLAQNELWKGALQITDNLLPYYDNTFDLIFCIEVFEHIPENLLNSTVSELFRIIKPKTGRILATTPNSENLNENKVFCPECGALFHRWQHLRSFNSDSLTKELEKCGFQTLLSDATNFARYQTPFLYSPLDWSLRNAGSVIGRYLAVIKDRLPVGGVPIGGYQFQKYIGKGEHLFWFGMKS